MKYGICIVAVCVTAMCGLPSVLAVDQAVDQAATDQAAWEAKRRRCSTDEILT